MTPLSKTWIKAAAVIALIILGGAFVYDLKSTCASWRGYDVAQNAVLDKMKSPTTAKFPPIEEVKITNYSNGSCVYDLKGYVDAQNDFGAIVRTTFTARIGGHSGPPKIIWLSIDHR